MKYNPNPDIGDPVRVRLHDGSTLDCEFIGTNNHNQAFVEDEKGTAFIVTNKKPKAKSWRDYYDSVRIVYPIEQMDNYKARQK